MEIGKILGSKMEDFFTGCVTPDFENETIDIQLAVVHADRIEILDKVYFNSNKAVIQPRSFPLLDNVAQIMKRHTEITKLLFSVYRSCVRQ